MLKMNCWEFKKCGRQLGGDKVKELGVCPSAQIESVNGVHGGRNGGRACYVIAGTYCGGKVQGSFAQKLSNCMACEFYKLLLKEEGTAKKNSVEILALLSNKK